MSRLYGRSYDVYNACKEICNCNIKRYKKDKTKTDWNSVQYSSSKIELYLTDKVLKIVESEPITIWANPLFLKVGTTFTMGPHKNATLYVPRFHPIEEDKREFIFFAGGIASLYSTDNLPQEYCIPCEYGNIIATIFEYLYLKEEGKEDSFFDKHLYELAYNAKNYVRTYGQFEQLNERKNILRFSNMSEKKEASYNKFYQRQVDKFLYATLQTLVPMSSIDGLLQLMDKARDNKDIKEVIEKLVLNENRDRQRILNDMGIDSYGYNRLIKEYRKRG